MPAGPVILNSTPLVALWVLDRFELLRDLFGTIVIPSAVHTEFLATETESRLPKLADSPWIEIESVQSQRTVRTFVGLDRGEAEVLALAIERSARLVVIDERRGRRFADRLSIPLTGTLGLLLLAKERSLLTEIAPEIDRLQRNGLYLLPALVNHALSMANE
jgi:hypothetical protein